MLWLERNVYPARLLMRLKREEGRLMMDFDSAASAEARIALAGALDRTRARILEVIGAPKRPSTPPEKRGSSARAIPIEATATALDSNSEPIPALPAPSEGEPGPDDMP
jgi:hypothetical protein